MGLACAQVLHGVARWFGKTRGVPGKRYFFGWRLGQKSGLTRVCHGFAAGTICVDQFARLSVVEESSLRSMEFGNSSESENWPIPKLGCGQGVFLAIPKS